MCNVYYPVMYKNGGFEKSVSLSEWISIIIGIAGVFAGLFGVYNNLDSFPHPWDYIVMSLMAYTAFFWVYILANLGTYIRIMHTMEIIDKSRNVSRRRH